MEAENKLDNPFWNKADEERLESHLKLPAWQLPQESQQRLYAGTFNLGESITVDSLIKDPKQGRDADRLLEIIPINATQAYIRFTENDAAHRFAFTDPYTFLNAKNVDYAYGYESKKHSHITTLTPGRLELEGDKWRLTEKIGIRFDGLTPELNSSQFQEKQHKPGEVENTKPDPRLYEISAVDKERLLKDGLVPTPVYQGFLDNNKILLPHHQQPVVDALVARYLKNDYSLSGELMEILNSDPDTRKRHQQGYAAAKNSMQVDQPSSEALSTTSVPDKTQQSNLVPEPNPTYQPIGYTVATTERPDQLSDADSKFGQTIEFRFNPVIHETPLNQPGGSDTEALKVYEQIEATRYELMLPPEAEEIRQFLRNDGYLSNEEISKALYDAGLKREELQHTVETLDTSKDSTVIDKITNYLWDVHESVMDSPLRDHLDPAGAYHLTAIIHNPDGLRAQEQLPQTQEEITRREAEREHGVITKLLSLKTFEGGMVANMLHNYKLMEEITQKLLGVHNQSQTQTTMEIPTATRYEWNQIKEQMERNGVTRESLEKSGNLDNLLNGRRTETLQLSRRDEQGTETPVSGRLYITEVPGKGPVVYLSPERQELRLPVSYQGHVFSKQDQENLLKTGEMGRVVTLKDKITGDPFKAFIGVDPTNKSLTVMRQERFTPPTKLLGAELTPEQREALRNHQVIRVRNMIGEDQKPFTADVQMNVNKRSFAFKRVNEQTESVKANVRNEIEPANTKKSQQAVQGVVPEQGTIKQPKKQKQDAGIHQETSSKQAVSVAAKNGQQRISIDKSTSGPTQTGNQTTPQVKPGKKENQTIVNGTPVKQQQTPKKRRSPKL